MTKLEAGPGKHVGKATRTGEPGGIDNLKRWEQGPTVPATCVGNLVHNRAYERPPCINLSLRGLQPLANEEKFLGLLHTQVLIPPMSAITRKLKPKNGFCRNNETPKYECTQKFWNFPCPRKKIKYPTAGTLIRAGRPTFKGKQRVRQVITGIEDNSSDSRKCERWVPGYRDGPA